MDCLALLGVNRDVTVHLLHSFFSILTGPYSTDWWIFTFVGVLPSEALPPVADIPEYSFAVQCTVHAVLRVYQQFCVEVVPPPH